MIIGICINNILRDHLTKVCEAYTDLTGLEPVLPINPYDLEKSFPTITDDAEISVFNPDDKDMVIKPICDNLSFNIFELMYEDASFEIFGRSEETYYNIVYKLGELNDKNTSVVLLNKETNRSKCATLFFLSKSNFIFDKIVFPENYKDFWKHCDVLVTDNPYFFENPKKNKISVKVKNEFNIDYDSDFTILNITELNSIKEDIKLKYNKLKSK